MEQRREWYEDRQAPDGREKFATAALTCGIISLVLCITGLFGIPFAALAFLFAYLSRNRKEPLGSRSVAGAALGIVGIFLGIALTVNTVQMLRSDPTMLDQMEQMYESVYGTGGDFTAFRALVEGQGFSL